MDQGKFIDINEMDASKVDLNAVPTSGESYLRQVVVGRSRCEQVVVTDRDFSEFNSKQTKQVPDELIILFKKENYSILPKEWRERQVRDFAHLRSRLFQKRAEIKKIREQSGKKKSPFPSFGNEERWKKFFFEECSLKFESEMTSFLEKHQEFSEETPKGTPPLLSIAGAMSAAVAADAFEFQVAWFLEEGCDKNRLRWLYILMLMIEKPLTPELCSSLRSLARECARLRRLILVEKSCEKDEETKVIFERSCTLLLCIIVDYFGQTDLEELF